MSQCVTHSSVRSLYSHVNWRLTNFAHWCIHALITDAAFIANSHPAFQALLVSTLCIFSHRSHMQLRWPQKSLCVSFIWLCFFTAFFMFESSLTSQLESCIVSSGSGLESFWGIQQLHVFASLFKNRFGRNSIPIHKLPCVTCLNAGYCAKLYRKLRPVFPVWVSGAQLLHNVISISTSSLEVCVLMFGIALAVFKVS